MSEKVVVVGKQGMDKTIASQSKHLIRYNVTGFVAIDFTQCRVFACIQPAVCSIGKMHAVRILMSFATAAVTSHDRRAISDQNERVERLLGTAFVGE